MAQRIVIEVGPKMGQEIPIRIVEQTCRQAEFGNGGVYTSLGAPLVLCSNGMPEFACGSRADCRTALYVRGVDRTKDDRIVAVPSSVIDDIKAIVMAFNKEYDSENANSGIVYWNDIGAKVTPANPSD